MSKKQRRHGNGRLFLANYFLGILVFPNGDKYEGNFTEGKKDGFGKYIWSN